MAAQDTLQALVQAVCDIPSRMSNSNVTLLQESSHMYRTLPQKPLPLEIEYDSVAQSPAQNVETHSSTITRDQIVIKSPLAKHNALDERQQNAKFSGNSQDVSNSMRETFHSFRVKAQSCRRRFCPCVCHRTSRIRSLKPFDKIFGSLLVGFRTIPILSSRCDVEGCKRQRSTLQISYQCPTWLSQYMFIAFLPPAPSHPESLLRVYKRRRFNWRLRLALRDGDVDYLKRCLDKNRISPLDVNEYGNTLLHLALRGHANANRFQECINVLCLVGVDPDVEDDVGISFFSEYWTTKMTRGNNSKCLDTECKLPSRFSLCPDSDTLRVNDIQAAILGLPDAPYFEDALREASKSELDALNGVDMTALMLAASKGDVQRVSELIDKGASVDVTDSDGLNAFSYCLNDIECFEKFRNSGLNPLLQNEKEETLLHIALKSRYPLDTLKRLYAYGIDVNSQSKMGTSLIHILSDLSCRDFEYAAEVLEWLVSNGADANLKSSDGIAPLTWAMWKNNYPILGELLRYKPLVRNIAWQNRSLLHLAALNSDTTSMQILLDAEICGLESDIPCDDGWTALEEATFRRNNNSQWADIFEAVEDPDPELWFQTFKKLYDDILERSRLEIATRIFDNDWETSSSDSESGEEPAGTMPGSFPED